MRTRTLLLMASVVDGMAEGAVVPLLQQIAATLCHSELSQTMDADLQLQVTEVVLSAVEKSGRLDTGAQPEEFFFNLLRTLLYLIALGSKEVVAQAREGVESIGEMLGMDSARQLYEMHFQRLLQLSISQHQKWASKNEPGFGFFESLLRESGGKISSRFIPLYLPALVAGCQPSRDVTLRLAVLALLETVVTDDADAAGKGFKPFSSQLIHGMLVPNMTWRAGRVESTIRKLSVACLLNCLKCGALSPNILFSSIDVLAPVMVSTLSDDYDTSMRHLTCLAFRFLFVLLEGRLGEPQVHQLYPELLKRLDDSCDDVRKAIVPALKSFFACAAPKHFHHTCRQVLVETLLLHMDDVDTELQQQMFEALVVLTTRLQIQPLLIKHATTARTQHRSPDLCDALVQQFSAEDKSDTAAEPISME